MRWRKPLRRMGKLYSECFGAGQDVVLLHGWSMHSGMWDGFAQALANDFRVTCIDLPGHGNSEMCTGFDLDSVSEALIQAAPENASWLGWSLGATLVMGIAQRFPDRVNGVALLAGNAKFVAGEDWPTAMDPSLLRMFASNLVVDSKGALLRFLSLQTEGMASKRHLLKNMRECLNSRNPPKEKALLGGLAILEQADYREDLRNIHCPVMLVYGELDTLVPVAASDAMREVCPKAIIRIVKGAGHMPFFTHAGTISSDVKDFLSNRLS